MRYSANRLSSNPSFIDGGRQSESGRLRATSCHIHCREQQDQLAFGVPNFRHLDSIPVGAVAQPSVRGVRAILAHLGARSADTLRSPGRCKTQRGQRVRSISHAVHCSGRISSVVYTVRNTTQATQQAATHPKAKPGPLDQPQGRTARIHQREGARRPRACTGSHEVQPFLLRSSETPFRCLPEFTTGMTAARMQSVEERLKLEVLQEAKQHEGKIVVHVEKAHRGLNPRWEAITDHHRQECTCDCARVTPMLSSVCSRRRRCTLSCGTKAFA